MENNFLVLIPEAVYEELNQVFAYYEERQTDLGVRFLDDWEETMDNLELRPFIHQIQFKQFRSVKFNRFPFLIIYKIEKQTIILYKLVHAKSDPAKRYSY